jgi:hypothetical protein
MLFRLRGKFVPDGVQTEVKVQSLTFSPTVAQCAPYSTTTLASGITVGPNTGFQLNTVCTRIGKKGISIGFIANKAAVTDLDVPPIPQTDVIIPPPPPTTTISSGDRVYFRTSKLFPLNSHDSRGRVSAINSITAGRDEAFIIRKVSGGGTILSGDKVWFETTAGYRFNCPDSAGCAVSAVDISWVGRDETFTISKVNTDANKLIRIGDAISLRTTKGWVLNSDDSQGVVAAKDLNYVGRDEMFVIDRY